MLIASSAILTVVTLASVILDVVTELELSFVVETAATDMDILTDGTDKFVGGVYIGVTDATGKTFISGASNDVITQNGSTKGGLAGSIIRVTAMASAKYAVEGLILGSGTLVTPFADS